MINLLLKAKHWQVFLLSVVIPVTLQIVVAQMAVNSMLENTGPYDPNAFQIGHLFPFIVALPIGILFSWFWSIGVGLGSRLPDHLRLNVGLFKTFLLIPVAYLTFILLFSHRIFAGSMVSGEGFNMQLLGIMLLLHLFSVFCIFYCMYFVAKTYKTAELQREVSFSDFIGEFFLVWFYPVGIWFLQPRLNKMAAENSCSELEEFV